MAVAGPGCLLPLCEVDGVFCTDDTWFLNIAAQQIRDAELKRAERLNGRLTMLGFLIDVAIEAFTAHGILPLSLDSAW
jgi:hypothetical protein